MNHKTHIARHFNKAADCYDACASIQYDIGLGLIQRLAAYSIVAGGRVMDIGAGTGKLTPLLMALQPDADYFLLDIAHRMLVHSHPDASIRLVCADFDVPPFASETFDLIFSSMSLQWSVDLFKTITVLMQLIKKNGYLAIALPIEGTLSELSAALTGMGYPDRVNCFWSADALRQMLLSCSDTMTCLSTEECVFFKVYSSVKTLVDFIKKTGASYAFDHNHASFNARGFLKKIGDSRTSISATFNIYYAILQKI